MPLPSPLLHLFLLTPAPDVTYCVATMTLCGEHYKCMPTNRQVGRPQVTDFQDEEFTLGILRNSGIPQECRADSWEFRISGPARRPGTTTACSDFRVPTAWSPAWRPQLTPDTTVHRRQTTLIYTGVPAACKAPSRGYHCTRTSTVVGDRSEKNGDTVGFDRQLRKRVLRGMVP